MKFTIKYLILFLIIINIPSCGYNSTKIPESTRSEEQLNNSLTQNSYSEMNQLIFTPHCIRCHSEAGGNKGGINLESYERVKIYISRVENAIVQGFMPPAGPLSDNLKLKLTEWIKAGLPEVGGGVVVPAPLNPSQPPDPVEDLKPNSFINITKLVFKPYCLRCHSVEGGNTARVNLETYENVIEELRDIQKEVNRGYMPPSGALPPSIRSKLNTWIAMGAPR